MNNQAESFKPLILGISGYHYADLHKPEKLSELLKEFEHSLKTVDSVLYTEFINYRNSQGKDMSAVQISELLIRMAPLVGSFIAKLFNIEKSRIKQINRIQHEFDHIFVYRNEIISKLNKHFKLESITSWDIQKLQLQLEALLTGTGRSDLLLQDPEMAISELGSELWQVSNDRPENQRNADGLQSKALLIKNQLSKNQQIRSLLTEQLAIPNSVDFIESLLNIVRRWSFAAQHIPKLQVQVVDWVSFKTPTKKDFNNLVEHVIHVENQYPVWAAHKNHLRRRDGFTLTDKRFNQRQVLYEVDHCIYCHDRDTDSCSKGMTNKKDSSFKVNPLGVTITGCPLEEKISEMHILKRQGDNIGALAIIMLDNPMCPGTGHRICNDCMKGCIYQKTEPVDIPQIETNVLTDVLFMPWGFEIYSLLSRWNPLNIKQPHALPYNGKNILVAGMGPSGYTLSHYLLNEGFAVVGIDGLKVEPLPIALTGDNETAPLPIRDFNTLYDDLDKRVMLGFGGVAEYGITVRWDKNFLKVIYLNLLRNQAFRCYGGVRFGGTLTINEAWDLGFDHIAIASGAGKPTVIDIRNNLIRGIRKASDFLMALQLSGAAKESSLANLQVRLPAGVIGGGLTAIDTATELLAYYPVQVSKILHRYNKLLDVYGEETVRQAYDEEELQILDEFLAHGRIIQKERDRAKLANEAPYFLPLLQEWGGVTLFYRKGITDSPAYRQNHEEIYQALAEGIQLAEGMSPAEAIADQYGHLQTMTFERLENRDGKWQKLTDLQINLRSLFIAAGTSPNTIYESEHPDSFEMDGKFYQRYEPEGKTDQPDLVAQHDNLIPKVGKPAPLTSYHRNGKFISFYGDNHPVYAGNVVKAMASAKDGYPYIVNLFKKHLSTLDPAMQVRRNKKLHIIQQHLDNAFNAQIVAVNRLTPTIIEVVVRAPLAARKFCPGQFYRVQNYETFAPAKEGTILAAEGIALTGASVDRDKGLISLITLEMGSSTRLCATWKTGDPIVVMGVTGAATDIPSGQTVLLLGGGLGNAVLFSIGKAMRAAGNQVIYFAAYRNSSDVFKVKDIEAASDIVIWAVDKQPENDAIPLTRPQDKSFIGNIIEAMLAYARGELGATSIHIDDADHLIVIGSDRMMAAVKEARHGVLAPYLKKHHKAIGSINSPMQCMMKGVCAQCLCKHIDPETGEEYFVYSCYNQDQELDRVDFNNLHDRLRQNSVQEKLSSLWLQHLIDDIE
ncbi:pyridine nucleotide-disulfide oxidoreductase [Methyloprofundus sedimenti]|uniref:Pyridine nucleotide-disulfide oxidoreductase n=1 Tax=Methyloprofundus sedimenti TaxID=1420851 RepID=A0A1V8M2I8_9GAMM|nr:pyridine nucleotide-disulfide oxidoreductase [Methyloprofundus sedimenti]OQK15765.1 pyridine nucleotide-disulfide oxidoreductase [Methyloprofundus sedimenti]